MLFTFLCSFWLITFILEILFVQEKSLEHFLSFKNYFGINGKWILQNVWLKRKISGRQNKQFWQVFIRFFAKRWSYFEVDNKNFKSKCRSLAQNQMVFFFTCISIIAYAALDILHNVWVYTGLENCPEFWRVLTPPLTFRWRKTYCIYFSTETLF